jgi:hypothetical protein
LLLKKICPKFQGEKLSENISAETEFCKIDPSTLGGTQSRPCLPRQPDSLRGNPPKPESRSDSRSDSPFIILFIIP